MTKRVLITGASGLVGKAIQFWQPHFHQYEYVNVARIYGSLTEEKCVRKMFREVRPDYVIHTAARVGGIGGNMANHGDYFYENILMNAYMIHYATKHNVEKMFAFSSLCAFPDGLSEIVEDKLHDGPVFGSNFAYGYAKRMVDVQIQAYKKQYGIKNYCSIIPGSIFGEHDNYSLTEGHVLPMLIHKMYRAKTFDEPFVVWGDGLSMREFLYARDLGRNILKLIGLEEIPERIVMSGEQQYSIRDVVGMLRKAAEYQKEIIWDTSKPNGQRAKNSNCSLLHKLIDKVEYTPIYNAIYKSYHWFASNYPYVRGVNGVENKIY